MKEYSTKIHFSIISKFYYYGICSCDCFCFFLVIYYWVGYLSVTSIRKTRSEKPPRSSAFFLRMLLISSSVVPSCSARAFISSSRSDSSSSLSVFVFASIYSVSSSLSALGNFVLAATFLLINSKSIACSSEFRMTLIIFSIVPRFNSSSRSELT